MAEGLAIAASVIAVIQLTDRIANAVNFYVETLRDDLPSDLRVIVSETAALKTVFEKLHSEVDETVAQTLAGPVDDYSRVFIKRGQNKSGIIFNKVVFQRDQG